MATQEHHDQLLARMTRYLDYFQALTEVGKTLTKNLQLAEVLESIMRCVTQLLTPKDWSLLLVDEARDDIYFEIVVGEAAEKLKGMRLRMGEGIAGWVALHRVPLIVPRVADDPRFSNRMDKASNFQTSSILCVPLVCRDRTLGVIELVKPAGDPQPFVPEDLEILVPLADFAAIAIDNARAFHTVRELTMTDEWTSLYNARFLRNTLVEEVRRAQRYHHPLSVAFFDLDHFKDVNDTHGHAAGSALLREVGTIMRNVARDTDKAVRYGGDEFVVLMPETPKGGAINLAERIRVAIEAQQVGGAVKVTASFGVATYPDDAQDADSLLGAADRAMYAAKAGGRNATVDAAALPAAGHKGVG